MTFYNFLKKIYEARPEHIAFSYYRGEERTDVTVAQWVQHIFDLSEYVGKAYGRNSGTHIAVTGKSSYEWYVAVFGIVLSGNIAVSVNPDLAEEDLIRQLKCSDSAVLYREEEEEWLNVTEKAGIPQKSITEVLKESDGYSGGRIFGEDCASDDRGLALILFSSGTSGLPKGVMLSQENIMAAEEKMEGIFDGGRMMMMLPLHHVAAIYFSIALMRYPVTLCICSSPKYLVRDMKRYHPTIMAMVPAQLTFIVSRCKKDKILGELVVRYLDYVICGGASLENEYQDIFREWKIRVVNAYGLTETAGGITTWFPHKERSIGRIVDANEMKIEDGELLIRGKSVMLGYYKDPVETDKVFRDGWLCTGDLVSMDEEGFLYVTGRKKNIIVLSNGENISPEELESKIYRIPGVEEVVVSGDNSILEAQIYPGEDAEEEIRNRIHEGIREMNLLLPRFQQISKVTFRNEPFLKTGSGKIRRNI